MRLNYEAKEILNIQKFRRIVSYSGFYLFTSLLTYAFTSNTTRAGYSRGDQFYASYPAGTELLTDTAKLYKAALGNCFEAEGWGRVEFCIMAKHFERQGKSPYAYHSKLRSSPSKKKRRSPNKRRRTVYLAPRLTCDITLSMSLVFGLGTGVVTLISKTIYLARLLLQAYRLPTPKPYPYPGKGH